MERLAARVKRQSAGIFGNVDVQQHIGLVDAHVGALARLLAEVIHDGVLHAVGYELAVAELFAEHDSIHGK